MEETTVMPRPAAVHHIALQVKDLPVMERFYAGLLGLPVLRRWPAAGGGERSIWLDLGAGAFLALEAVAADAELVDAEARPGWFLLALRIGAAERTAVRRALLAAGHPVYRESAFTLYVRDPEGNRVGLSHHPDPSDDAVHHV